VLENSNYKLYYDWSIITDQSTHNKPEIVILDKITKEAHHTDGAIPN
jgi:hypothetical protein